MTPNHPSLSPEKQALIAVRKLRQQVEALERARTAPIAIVGMACDFPGGASDPQKYWRLLLEQRSGVREIPSRRFDIDSLYDPDPKARGKTYSRWAGLLERVDLFDAEYFGIAPREAVQMDPQQRLLLEVASAALEDAGIAAKSLTGSDTGVFIGITVNEYAKLQAQIVSLADIDAYFLQSSALNAAPGRLSYFLGLHGPSMAIDTACSSSLVAVDRACRSLREGESSMAIAGGVNVIAVPEAFISASRWGLLAHDGKCKAFDAAADGFVRGEGCGIVILKRLADALAAGDPVLAVIRGTAVNQDGSSGGLTVPNGPAQEALIRKALKNAGIEPKLVSYVEAHGTGASLGDPIEAEALAAALGKGRDARRPLMIGSVKTNLGHLESAAG